MFKERAHQGAVVADISQLRIDAFLQLLAPLQRSTRIAGALGIAPYQFIGIQIRCIAGQAMQRELAVRARHILLHDRLLVGGQAIHYPVQRLLAVLHQLLEQLHKQLARQRSLIGGKPERALGTDGGGGAEALALSGNLYLCPFTPQVLPWTASARKPDSSQK